VPSLTGPQHDWRDHAPRPRHPRRGHQGEGGSPAGPTVASGLTRAQVLSAHRAGVRKIILPRRNRKDVDADLPERVRKDVTFVYARTIWDALEVGFGDALWDGVPDVRERQASRRLTDTMLESRL
jgi:hypothetical protein